MEDAEKRSERLKVMRAVASAQAETCNDNVETSAVPGLLANPLLENPATQPALEELSATPRFDFYTDPSAAFSANRKRTATANQVARSFTPPNNMSSMPQFSSPRPGQGNLEVTPSSAYQMQNNYSPANQMQSNYSPNQRMYPGQGPYHNAAFYRTPSNFARPFTMNQGTPEMWNGPGGPASYHSSTPYRGISRPYPIHQGNPGFGPVGISPSPVSGYGGSPASSGRGQGYWDSSSGLGQSGYGESPASSGRGQGYWDSSSGLGQSGGRGRGFRSRGFALNETQEPECFYDNSMVEDPWQHLKPVLWRGVDDPGNNLNGPVSSNSWLPKSIGVKKSRISESSNKSTSGQTLAEYLSAAFTEATNDAPNV